MAAPPPRTLRPRFRFPAWLLLPAAALALAAGTLWLATEPAPMITDRSAFGAHTAAGAGALAVGATPAAAQPPWLRLRELRQSPDGRPVTLRATAEELELLADQAAHLFGGAARARLAAGQLTLQFSVPLHRWGRRWLNVELLLRHGTLARDLLVSARVGRIQLPPPLAKAALGLALAGWDRAVPDIAAWHTMLQDLQLQPGQIEVTLRWRAELPRRLVAWMMPAERLARLRPYHDALREAVLQQRAQPAPPALTALMAPVFALAAQRSDQSDPVAETRAALLVLAVHASGQTVGRLWPQAAAWPRIPWRAPLFGGRGDFAQHYLVSAALAAEGGGPVADALGAMKEISDSRGGSGFSFTDIAVNRAGARLGALALRAPTQVQALLAGAPPDDVLLPPVADLPEFMGRQAFEQRFGGVGQPAYAAMLATIDARLDAMRVYR